jgi:magnesium transporter
MPDEQDGAHATGLVVGLDMPKAYVGDDDPVILDCAVYREGSRVETVHDLDIALEKSQEHPDNFLWIGLHQPTADEFERVAREFELHPLAVEDAIKAHQRPKLEEYGGVLFVVLKTVEYDTDRRQVELGELMLFVGDTFIISVRHGNASPLGGVRRRLEEEHELLRSGPSAVLYAVIDHVVDIYTDVAAELEVDIDEEEKAVFSTNRGGDASSIYQIKREVIEFRRAVMPLVEPTNRLAEAKLPVIHESIRPFLRDVADHVLRTAEMVEGFDELLTSVLSAHLALVGVRQNDDMRRISAWVAIAVVPTSIGAIYGMNFDHMPELHWQYGYPAALVAMALICLGLYRGFKRSGWL